MTTDFHWAPKFNPRSQIGIPHTKTGDLSTQRCQSHTGGNVQMVLVCLCKKLFLEPQEKHQATPSLLLVHEHSGAKVCDHPLRNIQKCWNSLWLIRKAIS